MADASYGTKVYHDLNGDRLNVVSGGEINVEDGADVGHMPRAIVVNVLAADINAGKGILAALAGLTLRVLRFGMIARGAAAAGCTGIILEDTAASPVVVGECAVANLLQDVQTDYRDANNTHAGVGLALTAAKGLKVVKDGANMTGATSVDILVEYITV